MRKLVYLIVCFLFSSALIMALVLSSNNSAGENEFTRLFPPHSVDLKNILELPVGSYYIAGLNAEKIYVGNYSNPVELLEVTYDLDVRNIELEIADSEEFTVATRIIVDTPNIFMMDSYWHNIFRGSVNEPDMLRYSLGDDSFSASVSLSPTSFVLSSFSRVFGINVLKKVNIDSVHHPMSIHNVLAKQVDGFFCTQGTLSYDKRNARLFYNYHYRNEFISLDTNLNVLYKGRTIDTISQARISVDTIESGDIATATFSTPPLIVNRFSCADDGYFFVNSGLMSSNEDERNFSQSSVVDIYRSENGEYTYSIYLSNHNGEKLGDFKIHNRKIVAINGHYLLLYHLNI